MSIADRVAGFVFRGIKTFEDGVGRLLKIAAAGLVAVGFGLGFLAASCLPAKAHGGYEWIMLEPRYVDRVGIHCCSTDCFPVHERDLYETNDGIVYLPTQERLQYRTEDGRNGGIYQTAEPDPPAGRRPWVCRRHDKLRCIFKVVPEG